MLLPTLHGDGGTAVNGGTVAVGFFWSAVRRRWDSFGRRYDGGGILLVGGTTAVGFFGMAVRWRWDSFGRRYDGGGILLVGGTTAVGFFWMAVRRRWDSFGWRYGPWPPAAFPSTCCQDPQPVASAGMSWIPWP